MKTYRKVEKRFTQEDKPIRNYFYAAALKEKKEIE
jgi:hypothetical protein